MSHKHNNEARHHKPATDHSSAAEAPKVPNEDTLEVSAGEVSRRAYFSYLNDGARPGRDVQHWLEAEAKLLEERKLTRTHGYNKPT